MQLYFCLLRLLNQHFFALRRSRGTLLLRKIYQLQFFNSQKMANYRESMTNGSPKISALKVPTKLISRGFLLRAFGVYSSYVALHVSSLLLSFSVECTASTANLLQKTTKRILMQKGLLEDSPVVPLASKILLIKRKLILRK